MTDTWNTWTAEEKAVVVATKVMGWHRGPRSIKHCGPCWFDAESKLIAYVADYCPTKDIAQAWEVQGRISDLELTEEWADALLRIYHQQPGDAIFMASADARCHAAVLAVKGKQP